MMETAPTILVVDDETMVLDLCRALLERDGFRVILARDGVQAVEVFQEHWRRIALVVLDWTLPRLSGDDVFRTMFRINPDVRVLFCSGYPPEQIRSLGHARVFGYIAKPFHNRDFVSTIRHLVEGQSGVFAAAESAPPAASHRNGAGA
jgi:two-component system, cell cycle sensor histidine kinase and response regulator CckA